MKKLLILFAATLMFSACSKCSKEAPTQLEANATWNVENVTNTDKQYMFTNYGGDYRWFETCILLQDYLDEECDGTVAGVSNVFQVVEEEGKSADVFVVLAAHVPDSTTYEVKQGFWVEDFPLENDTINLTYMEAFEKVMAVNCPKPHSKNCILRKPIGPLPCNAQYVFGNIREQLWVDAKTGEVKESNPAFPDDLQMPLGEWP